MNNCLPVSNHTNPLIAVYWDDMQTQGNNIRYGTYGTSPNRIFVVDLATNWPTRVAKGSAAIWLDGHTLLVEV